MFGSMTLKAQVLQEFLTGADGRITTPGKFKGQRLYVPYLYATAVEYGADGLEGNVLICVITRPEKIEFPELLAKSVVKLFLHKNGFVREIV